MRKMRQLCFPFMAERSYCFFEERRMLDITKYIFKAANADEAAKMYREYKNNGIDIDGLESHNVVVPEGTACQTLEFREYIQYPGFKELSNIYDYNELA